MCGAQSNRLAKDTCRLSRPDQGVDQELAKRFFSEPQTIDKNLKKTVTQERLNSIKETFKKKRDEMRT